MSKYIFGGLGLTAIGLGFQPYITAIEPYSLYFILGGLILFLFPLSLKLLRLLKDKNAKPLESMGQATPTPALNHTNKFPSVVWLTGKEVMDKYGLSAIELYQHIKDGLDVYSKDFAVIMLGDQAQHLSEYDISFEIDFDISQSSEMYDLLKGYHFKLSDIEEYQKTKK